MCLMVLRCTRQRPGLGHVPSCTARCHLSVGAGAAASPLIKPSVVLVITCTMVLSLSPSPQPGITPDAGAACAAACGRAAGADGSFGSACRAPEAPPIARASAEGPAGPGHVRRQAAVPASRAFSAGNHHASRAECVHRGAPRAASAWDSPSPPRRPQRLPGPMSHLVPQLSRESHAGLVPEVARLLASHASGLCPQQGPQAGKRARRKQGAGGGARRGCEGEGGKRTAAKTRPVLSIFNAKRCSPLVIIKTHLAGPEGGTADSPTDFRCCAVHTMRSKLSIPASGDIQA